MKTINISEQVAKSLLATRHWKTFVLDLEKIQGIIEHNKSIKSPLPNKIDFKSNSTQTFIANGHEVTLTIQSAHEISYHQNENGELNTKCTSPKRAEDNVFLPILKGTEEVNVNVITTVGLVELPDYIKKYSSLGVFCNDVQVYKDVIQFKPVELIVTPV